MLRIQSGVALEKTPDYDHEDLVALVSGAGLDAADVREYLEGEEGASEVRSSQEEASPS